MAERLTEQTVERLGDWRTAYTFWDSLAGSGLKVTPSGSKIWFMQTVYPGATTQSRRTLGKYPDLGIAAARGKAQAGVPGSRKD